MRNEVLYSKRLVGFKNATQKDDLWIAQAAKIHTTVSQLKIWYTNMRTMMGRLKKCAKKSRSGGDAITDMNSTEKWVWESSLFVSLTLRRWMREMWPPLQQQQQVPVMLNSPLHQPNLSSCLCHQQGSNTTTPSSLTTSLPDSLPARVGRL